MRKRRGVILSIRASRRGSIRSIVSTARVAVAIVAVAIVAVRAPAVLLALDVARGRDRIVVARGRIGRCLRIRFGIPARSSCWVPKSFVLL